MKNARKDLNRQEKPKSWQPVPKQDHKPIARPNTPAPKSGFGGGCGSCGS
jgi:hypothetical protein